MVFFKAHNSLIPILFLTLISNFIKISSKFFILNLDKAVFKVVEFLHPAAMPILNWC